MERLSTLLSNFDSLDKLKRLFWDELNYERVNQELRPDEWDDAIAEYPIVFAEAGSQGGFKVLYTRLKGSDLRLMHERTIITKLLRDFPYALFVFSNENEDTWHFVNVKIAVTTDTDDNRKAQKRRLFRRMTVAPPYNHLHTVINRITMLDLEQVSGRDLFGLSPLAIQQQHDTAFDVEAVTKEFFREYRRVFENAEQSITGIEDDDTRRLFTQKLFNRLMFIVFLEKKGWLTFNNDRDYVLALWKDYQQKREQGIDHNFYTDRLKLLFFTGLNNPAERDLMGAAGRPGPIQERIGNVPYLNGGLFERGDFDGEDSTVSVPDNVLKFAIDDIFYRFNFTVVESTPLDVEVAVDPEMLGKIFEELVTGRHESGSYYTPKPIVSFMGREALKGYLQTACPTESAESIAQFVDDHKPDKIKDPEKILDALKKVTICDPACGSGAYLVGMLHELIDLRLVLFNRKEIDAITGYQRKLEIIQSNIYGVDIDPFAVNIARLRLWLSLIVEFDDKNQEPPPLPNLDFKIEAGNSVVSPTPPGIGQMALQEALIKTYFKKKSEYIESHGQKKLDLKNEIEDLRKQIRTWIEKDKSFATDFNWAVNFAEVFAAEGFDIILANPPYVRQELIKEIKPDLKRIYGKLHSGTADLYVSFYLRSLQLLKPAGMMVFISSNKWLRAKYGKNLRNHIASQHRVVSITDFGELPVFQTASTFPMIFIAQKTKSQADQSFLFTQVKSLQDPYPNVLEILRQSGNRLPFRLLRGENWILTSEARAEILERTENIGITLEEYVDGRIYLGLKTGFNKAFIIDGEKRTELIAKDERSAEIIKPLAVGDDIRKWRINISDKWLILTQIDVAIERYPAIFEHLSQWEKELRARSDQGNHWWELRPCSYYSVFEAAKIVYPEIAKESRFVVNTDNKYTNNKTFMIPGARWYLLGILNSRIAWEYFKETCSVLGDANKGGRVELRSVHVGQLPIPQIDGTLKDDIARIARELNSSHGKCDNAAELEAELNVLVYQAYGLDDKDIAVMEGRDDHVESKPKPNME